MHRSILPLSAFALSLTLFACDFGTSSDGAMEDSSVLIGGGGSGEGGSTSEDAANGGTYVNAMGAGVPLSKSTDFAGSLLYNNDLENEDEGCWDARNSSGYARTPCGNWGSIGSNRARLMKGAGRDGSTALQVAFGQNEEVAGASLAMSADVINVRAYYNFAEGFDFGQGVKVARVSSFNEATQVNDIDMVMTVRSAQSSAQCGLTDMADLGMFFNGKPVGFDWGSVGAPVRFQRGRWYAVEYQVKLNDPGQKNGSVKIWVDGQLSGSKEGLDIRGKGGSEVKLNRIRVGGWYSNGANSNSCKNPSQVSILNIDDVAVGNEYIGT